MQQADQFGQSDPDIDRAKSFQWREASTIDAGSITPSVENSTLIRLNVVLFQAILGRSPLAKRHRLSPKVWHPTET
ncbi:MAG: hypothetical protein IGR76_07830 [Synechococcales cyanobacterium T60_A2020_003]|nr:hypothetical protein [Synechococcales cyanobacterium T60_A2020_003]